MTEEKKAFEESLRRFQEKGAALRAALETAQKTSTGNVAALKKKHQVGGKGGGFGVASGDDTALELFFVGLRVLHMMLTVGMLSLYCIYTVIIVGGNLKIGPKWRGT